MSLISKSTAQLRLLPSVDELLRDSQVARLRESFGTKRVTGVIRYVLADLRHEIRSWSESSGSRISETNLLNEAITRITNLCLVDQQSGLQNLINATGVVLHTNLGRAPLSDTAREAINNVSRYCTLEYDYRLGARGQRGGRVEFLLQQLTGAEDALVVNNCAAAALLVLSVIAGNGETIVSRGELVEIGGDFRVPDVMAISGTRMIEVGTTNRTSEDDYARAINEQTRLIMRVHPSNYRIVGFVASPSLAQLASIAHSAGIFLYEDAGSGLLQESTSLGLADENSVSSRIREGADVVTFSGDKLLGAAQAGLIVGKREVIDRLRKHPMYRALRCDKLRLAALEATLQQHQRDSSVSEIPILQMLALSSEQIEQRARKLIESLTSPESPLKFELLLGESAVGGGAAPTAVIPTTLIGITHHALTAAQLESHLRQNSTPIICRIADDRVIVDLRTVFPDEEAVITEALKSLKKLPAAIIP